MKVKKGKHKMQVLNSDYLSSEHYRVILSCSPMAMYSLLEHVVAPWGKSMNRKTTLKRI